jgi:hypothetical protein
MENVGIFYNHFEYFTAILYNLWPFGIGCGYLVYFSKFGRRRKIWQPLPWIMMAAAQIFLTGSREKQ